MQDFRNASAERQLVQDKTLRINLHNDNEKRRIRLLI
jgi:hypothetical protein